MLIDNLKTFLYLFNVESLLILGLDRQTENVVPACGRISTIDGNFPNRRIKQFYSCPLIGG